MLSDLPVTINRVTPCSFQKHHFNFRLGALDPLFDFTDRLFNIAGMQIRPHLHMSINQNLLRRQMHRQQFDDSFNVRVAFDCLFDRRQIGKRRSLMS